MIDSDSNLADQISSEETFDSYVNGDFHSNFKFYQINEKKVSMVINKNGKISCGLDGISNSLIKNSSENNLLCSEQFGFRSGYSNKLAALRLVDQMISHLDAGIISLNI